MNLAIESLAKTLHMGQPGNSAIGPIIFKAGAPDAPLTAGERKALLERVRAGEAIEIEVEATTYIQRADPNRNAIRFKDTASALRKIAKSGKNTPVLRDHESGSVMARGGTVLSSVAEKVGEEWHFKQRLKLVKPWAVEGVLDGTIDRFSIGWYPTGPILYSHNGKEVEGWPDFWPGDQLEDGTIVEWVYTSADLIEVSGVNVPAVTGTHIEGIRAALAANSTPQPQREKPPTEEDKMSKKILSALGLNDTASDDIAVEKVAELQATIKSQAAELSATEALLKQAEEVAEKAKAEAKTRGDAKLESDIADLYKAGKLTHSRSAAGVVGKDDLEDELRSLHAIKPSMFDSFASKLKSKGPAVELQSDDAVSENEGTGYDEGRLTRLRSSGMTPERHAELSAKRAAKRAAQGRA
jgi:hypothetical protein